MRKTLAFIAAAAILVPATTVFAGLGGVRAPAKAAGYYGGVKALGGVRLGNNGGERTILRDHSHASAKALRGYGGVRVAPIKNMAAPAKHAAPVKAIEVTKASWGALGAKGHAVKQHFNRG